MKYLVTGGAGFIGSHLTKKLVEKGDSVTVIDNLNTGKEENLESVRSKIDFEHANILDTELLEKVVKNVDGVFHQAALASVQDSFLKKNEYNNVNVNGTENIFRLAQKYGFKVVYASSSSIYGNPKKIPIEESHEKNPINPYAETKLKKEKLAKKYSEMGVKVIGLRYFNVFGKGQSKEYAGVLKIFLDRIKNRLPPKVNGNGTQFRDFVHVSDVVNANILAMNSNIKHEFFNVGTNTSITILDLATKIIEFSGLDIKPIFGPALDGDVMETIANVDLIKEKLGWKPKIMLSEWIKDIVTAKKFEGV